VYETYKTNSNSYQIDVRGTKISSYPSYHNRSTQNPVTGKIYSNFIPETIELLSTNTNLTSFPNYLHANEAGVVTEIDPIEDL
jgi:hypothetical protein